MRLLNTKTLQLEDFLTDIPKYAILSHTWGNQEVTFQDIQNLEVAKRKAGFSKVYKACERACNYSFEWIWIDSCCINKESSAELSEAINSMYQYYEDAGVCYAYLCDASREDDPRYSKFMLQGCRWFKRGWTLQELLAPSFVVFLDKHWAEIGTRWSLRDAISAITSIPSHVFEDAGVMEKISIAQKMSWAALRETTRPEDQAYCLMGLFGVSMSPIYGEGSAKAFMRLQQEIIKISDDRSIFAWRAPAGDNEPLRGLFARSPSEFRLSGDVGISESIWDSESSYSFANNGLHIRLPLIPAGSDSRNRVFIASLHCRSDRDGQYFSVYLKNTAGRQFVRCRPDELVLDHFSPAHKSLREIIVKETSVTRRKMKKPSSDSNSAVFHVRFLPPTHGQQRPKVTFLQPCISKRWATFNEKTGRIEVDSLGFNATAIKCRVQETDEEFALVIGPDVAHNDAPRFKIVTGDDLPETPDDLENIWPATESEPRKDRILAPLKSGGLISLAIQMTGKRSNTHRILEIDYIPRLNPNVGAMTKYLGPRSPQSQDFNLNLPKPLRQRLHSFVFSRSRFGSTTMFSQSGDISFERKIYLLEGLDSDMSRRLLDSLASMHSIISNLSGLNHPRASFNSLNIQPRVVNYLGLEETLQLIHEIRRLTTRAPSSRWLNGRTLEVYQLLHSTPVVPRAELVEYLHRLPPQLPLISSMPLSYPRTPQYRPKRGRGPLWNYFDYPPCLRITYPARLLITYPGYTLHSNNTTKPSLPNPVRPPHQLQLLLPLLIPVTQFLDLSSPSLEAHIEELVD